ncbi:GRB2-associated and regulator of MAPK [Chlorella sorokiniana]|uniref:GRB2-associated and regulator of MAPK n=1 Tax=Chlorella sorokiniana TaxID=3076 RepID=A0A2P6TL52_CHLSO|nr:GRB2-associated and regulator of MAPK [Chlorella sorokiniana]|eukprot:PRW45020.1 GRB2-associated and regulator of MAPK [Chlorella sorokiniana]
MWAARVKGLRRPPGAAAASVPVSADQAFAGSTAADKSRPLGLSKPAGEREPANARARAHVHERLLATHPELAFPCARPKAASSSPSSPCGSPTALAAAATLPWLWDAAPHAQLGGNPWGQLSGTIPTPLMHKPADAASSFLFHLELKASAADIIAGRGPGSGGGGVAVL